MAKRGRRRGRRGSGSIVERDGKYLARYSKTEGGIRKRVSKTFTLRGGAEWWLGESTRHGEAPSDPRLRDYMERWLAGKRRVAPSTRRMYAEHVELHIVPVLGGFKLAELRDRHVQAFVEDRLRYVSPTKHKQLSPSTVGKLLMTLRSALEAAVPREIPDNPAAKVEAPKVEREPVQAMTRGSAVSLLASVKGTWMEHVCRVLLGSGMRVGEAVALNQGDVHDGWVGLRKSKTTIRAVRLSADADAAIHEAIAAAPRVGKSEPVFFSPRRRRGGQRDRMHATSLTHALGAASGGEVTAKTLRHGTATLMVAAGVPMRVVAEQLGHADPSMTARVYAHVAPESLASALDTLDDAVSGR